MTSFTRIIGNEEGFVLIASLVILVMLTLIGAAATNLTSAELKISASDKFQKIAFFSAEAGRSYVPVNPQFYGSQNIEPGVKHYVPNDTDPYVPNTGNPNVSYTLGVSQTFSGSVEYVNATNPPRSSGYEAGKYRAHCYKMKIRGEGPNASLSEIEAGFYRIGF